MVRDRNPSRVKIVKAALTALVALSLLAMIPTVFGSTQGGEAVVRRDGCEVARYGLAVPGEYRIESEGDVNVVEVADGRVRVTDANCPHADCVRQGWIDVEGQAIVCLPHRLSVSIEGAGPAPSASADSDVAPDAVAR